MSPERWQQVSNLFDELIDQPPASWSDRLASQPNDIQSEVLELLKHSSSATARLESIVQSVATAINTIDDEPPPSPIGPFHPVRQIGRGGMGSVWLAERIEGGFSQRVAIKLLHRGMDTREVLRLFHQESRILSLLQHPNIARLLDAGQLPDGRPYIIMDFIDGQPLLAWAKDQSVPQLLHTFLDICSAIQYAHSSLIVHRDLKPGNILIDAQGHAKVLDFGIAKILAEANQPDSTRTAVRLYTPGFASPEQQSGAAITIATDIYSLGALLEALLPGSLPADLAAIIARARREEPHLRYATVDQLAADIRNYLAGHPVLARQGNFAYLASRFLSRHRYAVAAAAAFLLLLTGSLCWSLYQSRQIAAQRDRAETVSRFLSGLFAAADPEHNQGARLTINDLLDDGLNRARAIADPADRLTLMDTIALAYFDLGLYEKSAALHLELARAYEATNQIPSLAKSLAFAAEAESARDHHDQAQALATRAVTLARSLDPSTLATVLHHQCVQLHQAARFDLAVKACTEADSLAARTTLPATERASILVALARAQQDQNQLPAAEQSFARAMPFARSSGQNINSTSAQVLSGLASLYYRQDKFKEAESALREAIAFKRKLYPNGHLDLARSLNNLANIVSSQQRDREAIPIFEEAHKYYRQSLGAQSSELASSLSNLAMAKSFLREFSSAATIMQQVVTMQAATVGPGKLPHINSQIKYASLLSEDLGRPLEARPILESALAALAALPSPPPMQINYAKSMLAYCLTEAGNATAAQRLARESRTGLTGVLPPQHRLFSHIDLVEAGALVRLNRHNEAQVLLAPIIKSEGKNPDSGWRARYARALWAQLPERPR